MHNESYALVMNGNIWDCSTHMSDIIRWGNKIKKEEPDALLEVFITTREAADAWRSEY